MQVLYDKVVWQGLVDGVYSARALLSVFANPFHWNLRLDVADSTAEYPRILWSDVDFSGARPPPDRANISAELLARLRKRSLNLAGLLWNGEV
jgi:hypothetical protein